MAACSEGPARPTCMRVAGQRHSRASVGSQTVSAAMAPAPFTERNAPSHSTIQKDTRTATGFSDAHTRADRLPAHPTCCDSNKAVPATFQAALGDLVAQSERHDKFL